MNRRPPDELLWELSEAQVESDAATLNDATLSAYRSGSLPAAEVERVEAVLCRSPRARARLARLAGMPVALPPERVRRRLFDRAGARRRMFWSIAAAVLAAAVVIPVAYRMLGSRPAGPGPLALPPGLAFEVRVEGLAPLRAGDRIPVAHPDTSLRILLEPRREAVAGLAYALYRQRDGAMRRLDPGDNLTVEESRGSVTFVTTAAALVGSTPGEHAFFVVVARDGALPGALALDPARSPEALLGDVSGGLVYRRTLTVLDRDDPS